MMAKLGHVLIVDDEATIREVLRKYLEADGYRISEAKTGDEGLVLLRTDPPDLVILDIMLPGIDGFEITRLLRGDNHALSSTTGGDIPIILLTARTSELDRISGFELGADDYVVKPFSPRELVARVKAVLRRSGNIAEDDEKPVDAGGLHIDPRAREVRRGGKSILLTAKEFDLLLFLARHPRHVFSREQILNQVWGYEFFGDESTVTVHIRRLREKIEDNPAEPHTILTVWGVGYKFETE